jgi:hypothetical protein
MASHSVAQRRGRSRRARSRGVFEVQALDARFEGYEASISVCELLHTGEMETER